MDAGGLDSGVGLMVANSKDCGRTVSAAARKTNASLPNISRKESNTFRGRETLTAENNNSERIRHGRGAASAGGGLRVPCGQIEFVGFLIGADGFGADLRGNRSDH